MKRTLRCFWLLALPAALLAAVLSAGCVRIGALRVKPSKTALTISEGPLPASEALEKLRRLSVLDLRGHAAVTASYVEEAVAALPEGCALLWTVPLSDGAFDCTAESLTLPGCTAEDAALLVYFPQLKRVDATGSRAYAALAEAARTRPDTAFTYTLPLGEAVLTNADAVLTVPADADLETLLPALPYFYRLQTVDLCACEVTPAQMAAARTACPAVRFSYWLSLPAGEYRNDAEALDLTGLRFADAAEALALLEHFTSLTALDLFDTGLSAADARAVGEALQLPPERVRCRVCIGDAAFDSFAERIELTAQPAVQAALTDALPYFTALRTVELADGALDAAARDALEKAYPNVLFSQPVELYGRTVSNACTELDLSGVPLADIAEAEAILARLPRLEKLILSDCGLTDAQMAELCARAPQVRFVWTVYLNEFHSLRTDAVEFSTKNPGRAVGERPGKNKRKLMPGSIAPLVYCTALESLDLGHNYLDDEDLLVIAQLTGLRRLTLADNYITDLSPLTALKSLEYFEAFMCPIKDAAPLAELPALAHLNLCYTHIADLTPFYGMAQLERLWFSHVRASEADCKALAEALPDCECNYRVGAATGGGWR